MNSLRKRGVLVSSLLLSSVMTFSSVAPVFADDTTPTGTITAGGIETGKDVKVTAYQIVEGTYDTATGKLTGYKLVDKLTSTDLSDTSTFYPTDTELTALAEKIHDGDITGLKETDMSLKSDGSAYTATVEPGEYIILVTGTNSAKIYNPAVASVSVDDVNEGTTNDGELSFANYFKNSAGSNVYLKSSESSFDKKITSTTTTTDTNKTVISESGDVVAVGDTVEFEINNMSIPDYSEQYYELNTGYTEESTDDGKKYARAPYYQITDELEDDAFGGITSPSVTVGSNYTAKEGTDYTLTESDGTSKFTPGTSTSLMISFKPDFIKDHGTDSVSVKYSSTLLDTAGENFDENVNHAELKYTNDPNDDNGGHIEKDNTYHYTFAIDGLINGSGSDTTYEFNKASEIVGKYTEGHSANPLAGAVFTLYKDDSCVAGEDEYYVTDKNGKKVPYTATSDSNGHVNFNGLDTGTYYIKETTAPTVTNTDGSQTKYALNDTVYQVDISADIDSTTGILNSYTISIMENGKDSTKRTNKYTATEQKVKDDTTGEITQTGFLCNGQGLFEVNNEATGDDNTYAQPTTVIDTKLSKLPSTGGSGTIALTVIAAGGMAFFLTVYLKNKKQAAE